MKNQNALGKFKVLGQGVVFLIISLLFLEITNPVLSQEKIIKIDGSSTVRGPDSNQHSLSETKPFSQNGLRIG